jgi:hypothetical protein
MMGSAFCAIRAEVISGNCYWTDVKIYFLDESRGVVRTGVCGVMKRSVPTFEVD